MAETEKTKFEVDLDNERVFVDSRWLDRGELAKMLTERLASMDYNVGQLSSAIEFLDSTLKSLESFTVRLTRSATRNERAGVNVGFTHSRSNSSSGAQSWMRSSKRRLSARSLGPSPSNTNRCLFWLIGSSRRA